MKFVFVRHGETQGNSEKRFLGGRTDESLREEGIAVLEKFVAEKIYPDVDFVAASPMKRCLQTSEFVFPERKILVVENLREINFGDFENKTHEELKENADYMDWLSSKGLSEIPNGESVSVFGKRTVAAFEDFLSEHRDEIRKDSVIGFAVHGGTIMALVSKYFQGNYWDYMVSNGRGYTVDAEISFEDGTEVRMWNLEKI